MKIPRDVNGLQLVKALRILGYAVDRQKGSHIRIQRGRALITDMISFTRRHFCICRMGRTGGGDEVFLHKRPSVEHQGCLGSERHDGEQFPLS